MITKELVLLNLDIKDREQIIDSIITKSRNLELIDDMLVFKKGVYEREEVVPTSVGFGVAIPHCRSNVVKHPFVAFAKTNTPFCWDDRNKEQVDLIFLIGVPESNGSNLHLKFLSAISRKLMNEEFRASLRNARTEDEAFDILEAINKSIKGGE